MGRFRLRGHVYSDTRAVGVTPDAVAEMLCTIFLIYGMLIVRKATGNAWGCVLIFVLYWNAL